METGGLGFGWFVLCVLRTTQVHAAGDVSGDFRYGMSVLSQWDMEVWNAGLRVLVCRCIDDRVEEPAWRNTEHAP